MRICRFNGNSIGLVEGDTVVDVTAALRALPTVSYPCPRHDLMIAHLDALRPAIEQAAASGQRTPVADLQLDSPIGNPGKLVAAPVNYTKHLEEVREQADLHHQNQAHMRQIHETGLFLMATSSLIGPGQPVRIRMPDRRNDHEIELAVVIGTHANNVKAADALDYVAGYTIGLDMTVRGPEERSLRKSLDTFSVLGPWLVTADEMPDPGNLGFELKVNGEVRQSANTADMVLSVPDLIEFASRFYTLHPGDVIFTGTPDGVGPVKAGDVMQARFEGIGDMTVRVENAA